MLLAEVELALGSTEVSGKAQGGPAVKTLKDQNQKAGNPAQPVCRFWKSEHGCRQGAQCKFQHPAHDDGKYHCYTCGAPSHKKPDCPYNSPNKEGKTHTTTGASKGSPAGGSGAGGGDGKSPGKQGGKGSSKGKGGKANKEDQKGNSVGSKDDQKNVKKVETDGGKEAPADSKRDVRCWYGGDFNVGDGSVVADKEIENPGILLNGISPCQDGEPQED